MNGTIFKSAETPAASIDIKLLMLWTFENQRDEQIEKTNIRL